MTLRWIITPKGTRWRRGVLAALAVAIGVALATLVVLETDLFIEPEPEDETIALTPLELIHEGPGEDAAGIVTRELWREARMIAGSGSVDLVEAYLRDRMWRVLAVRDAGAVFQRTRHAGPWGLEGALGRDVVAIELAPVRPLIRPRGSAPIVVSANDEAWMTAVLTRCLRTKMIRARVPIMGPGERYWLNLRGAAVAAAWWVVLVAGPMAIAVWAIHRRVGSRPQLVVAGCCPRCLMDLRGFDGRACPECACAFTVHEQSILASLPPTPWG